MFTAPARFDIRFRWLIVAAWIAAVLAAVTLLPSLASVTRAGPAQLLSLLEPQCAGGCLWPPPSWRGDPTRDGADRRLPGRRAAHGRRLRRRSARVEQAVRSVPGVAQVTGGDGPRWPGERGPGDRAGGDRCRSAAPRGGWSRASGPPSPGAGTPPGLAWHLTGPLAASVDAASTGNAAAGNITRFTLLFVIVLLFLVYRAVLAPLVTPPPPRSPSRSPARCRGGGPGRRAPSPPLTSSCLSCCSWGPGPTTGCSSSSASARNSPMAARRRRRSSPPWRG